VIEWSNVLLDELVAMTSGKPIKPGLAGPVVAFGSNGVIGGAPHAHHDRGIIVGRVGAYCGSVALSTGPFWASDNTIVLTPRTDSDLNYLYYLLLDAKLNRHAGGAAQPLITQTTLKRLMYRVPIEPIRIKIGLVLRSFDDLIENNRRRIVLLEQMAGAIYREWFVRFRYPGHEDDQLVESPLGLLPASWQVRSVEELAVVVRGRSYRKHELVEDGGVPFINLKCMERGGGFRRDGLKRYTGPFKPEQVTSAGDIVLAVTDLTQSREILARATLVPRLPDASGVISLDVVRVVPRNADERIPLFAVLRYSDLADRVKEHANGSTVLHLSPGHVAAAPIIWPSQPMRHRAAAVLGSIYSLVDELSNAADHLARIRDILLPKLVTGAIDVSQLDLDALLDEPAA
jgi:type I restriction enzyme, S subunit